MRAWFFSENAYHLLPDKSEYDSIRVKLPNRYYDPKIGADLYHRFIDEWQIAEDLGLEIMVNEHHQTATNLNPSAAVVMGALARDTRKARLLILGNPIANRREPVRVAAEMAMVDVYSRGLVLACRLRGDAGRAPRPSRPPGRAQALHAAARPLRVRRAGLRGRDRRGRLRRREEAHVVPRVEQGAAAVHEPARIPPDRVDREHDEGRGARHLQDVPEPGT